MSVQSEDFKDLHVWGEAAGQTAEISEVTRLFIQKYIDTLQPDDAVLDIGCGEGKALRLIQENGHRVLGIDLNSEMISDAQRAGLPVKQMDVLAAIEEEGDNFNVFCMLDFVEHIPLEVFLEVLKKIAERPGAKVWIQTPNLDSIMGMKFWFHMPSHVTPLHPFVLRNILHRYGFEITGEWTDYGGIPWKGLRRRIVLKILYALFDAPLTEMFLGGGNICLTARVKPVNPVNKEAKPA